MTRPAEAPRLNQLRSQNEGASRSGTITEIAPSKGWRALGLHEIWRYRELMAYLSLRDVKLRYRQTLFGIAWAVLQPLLTTGVFVVTFGRVKSLGSPLVPYPLFVLAGLVGWQLFSFALTQSSMSVLNESRLITKIYFPRLLLPLAACGPGLLDFAISVALYFVVALFYGQAPGPELLALPLIAALLLLSALSMGILLSALTVRFRDFRFIIPFVVQVLLFASPVAYSAEIVTGRLRGLYLLNPLVPLLGYCRWALLGTPAPHANEAYSAGALVVAGLLFGLFYFRRSEASFADVA